MSRFHREPTQSDAYRWVAVHDGEGPHSYTEADVLADIANTLRELRSPSCAPLRQEEGPSLWCAQCCKRMVAPLYRVQVVGAHMPMEREQAFCGLDCMRRWVKNY